ncbi:hypothetical protein Gpo141_00002540 [Globisporangium polare]
MILEDYEALKCRYPSKKCWNQRAVKRNGERHNLCEMHRQKANNNQRRLDKKRKAGHLKGPGAENDSPSEIEYPQHQHMPQHHQEQDYEHQAEKRMRVRLTDMYVAAQSLSPHHHHQQPHPHHHHVQHMPTHYHSTRDRELAPLLPNAAASRHSPPRQQQMLHLPPLTSHIKKVFLKTEHTSPTLSKASSGAAKPTILLPPITSVPRCSQPYPLAAGGSGVSSASGSPHAASWSFRRYGKEEQINSA